MPYDDSALAAINVDLVAVIISVEYVRYWHKAGIGEARGHLLDDWAASVRSVWQLDR
jgi:hypothetical protein